MENRFFQVKTPAGCLPKKNFVFLILSLIHPCRQQRLPIIIETPKMQCSMVIPQILESITILDFKSTLTVISD